MDTSKEWIKMVIALPDEFWSVLLRDRLMGSVCGHCFTFLWDDRIACCKDMIRKPSPRQDQLQEMVFKDNDYLVQTHRLADFLDDCHRNKNYHHKFKTWEQFLLAFVMAELYKKRWNGNDWIKNNEL